MQHFETSVTEKGQVTIPLEIRRLMGLHPRDKVRFEVEGDTVRITKASSKLLQWFGSVKPTNTPENFDSIRDQFEKGVAEDVVSEG